MTAAAEILLTVRRVGGRLELAGDKLRVLLPADCRPELKISIRQHKRQLLDLLQTLGFALHPDEVPWVHVARQILAGEFKGTNTSTAEALAIGLRSISHPLCRRAVEVLRGDLAGRPAAGEGTCPSVLWHRFYN